MSAKLSVIFYIVLCLEIGIVLTLLPWTPQGTLGLSDWGNNYFLLYAARKTGPLLQTVVASGWMRGAVTGLGLLNIGIAFWEIFHFKQTVHKLQESTEAAASNSRKDVAPTTSKTNAAPATAASVSHHERPDNGQDNAPN